MSSDLLVRCDRLRAGGSLELGADPTTDDTPFETLAAGEEDGDDGSCVSSEY